MGVARGVDGGGFRPVEGNGGQPRRLSDAEQRAAQVAMIAGAIFADANAVAQMGNEMIMAERNIVHIMIGEPPEAHPGRHREASPDAGI